MRDSPLAAGDLQPSAVARWRWVETLLLTAAVPSSWFIAGVGQPLALHEARGFPWWVLVPLAIGAQHGLSCAFASVVGIAGVDFARAFLAGEPAEFLGAGTLCAAVVLIATRACDAQRERCERLRQRVLQLEVANERERRARRGLQLSHEKLEAQLAGAPQSVEATLRTVRKRIGTLRGTEEFGWLLLEVLAQHAQVREAAVWVRGPRGLVVVASSRAGGLDRVASVSAWVEKSLAERAVVSRLEGSDAHLHSGADEPLAAVPLVAADGHAFGVLSIFNLEFEAFYLRGLTQVEVLVRCVVGAVERDTWEGWLASMASGEEADRIDAPTRSSGTRPWDVIA
jgi:hypothetical protein